MSLSLFATKVAPQFAAKAAAVSASIKRIAVTSVHTRPKWCEKIANGEKTIEVRKTKPKLETPFKCYIYCTLPKYPHENFIATDYPRPQFYGGGKVIGEFTCDRIYGIGKRGIPENFDYCYLSLNEWGNDDIETEIRAISASCVSKEELNAYGAKAPLLYGWHISDLRIYDAPRELSEFERPYECNECDAKWATECNACHEEGKIKRAPQSWCYVEAMEDV
jgi:predicted transcriptional regulator